MQKLRGVDRVFRKVHQELRGLNDIGLEAPIQKVRLAGRKLSAVLLDSLNFLSAFR